MADPFVIETAELRKSYDDVEALRGLSLQVPAGSIYGFSCCMPLRETWRARTSDAQKPRRTLMRRLTRMLPLAVLLLSPAPFALAQTAVDPSGHWEGTVQAPNMDLKIEIDLARNAKGALAGTFTQLAQGVKGLPLSSVAVEGRAVTLELKAGSGGGKFRGAVLADGKSMSGTFVTSEGGHSVPFSLTRTGDARTAPAPKSPPIGKELEGTRPASSRATRPGSADRGPRPPGRHPPPSSGLTPQAPLSLLRKPGRHSYASLLQSADVGASGHAHRAGGWRHPPRTSRCLHVEVSVP